MVDFSLVFFGIDVPFDADDDLAVFSGEQPGNFFVGLVVRVVAGEKEFLVNVGG